MKRFGILLWTLLALVTTAAAQNTPEPDDDYDDYPSISHSLIDTLDSDSFPSDYSSSNTLENESSTDDNFSRPSSRRDTRPACCKRIQHQSKWCPGEALASILWQAKLPIYQWLQSSGTCLQFSRNLGDIGVLVIEPDSGLVCSAGSFITSTYTQNRALAINEPVYVNLISQSVAHAVASDIVFADDGRILVITVARPVSQLPDVC